MGNELAGILHGGVVASMIDSVGGLVSRQAARLCSEELGEPLVLFFSCGRVLVFK